MFRRRTLWESFLYRFWPAYRKAQDKKLREGIEMLLKDPSLPCWVENEFISNGYGQDREDAKKMPN